MKKVYKYATGVEIPEGAVYLSTQVETKSEQEMEGVYGTKKVIYTANLRVWHYFLVEVTQ